MTIAVVTLCVLLNSFMARKLPLIEGCLAVLHFAGLFVVIIVLWTLAPRNNAHDAFLQLTNNGGWSSDGLSMLVGLYPLTLCLLGFDSAVHMSEEIEGAARALPRSIMYSTYFNSALGLIMVITIIFTWGDMEEIAATPTGYPFIQVFYNVTNSYAGTTVLALLIILPLMGSVTACIATASRQIWAFARDNGVPFSSYIRHVRLSRVRGNARRALTCETGVPKVQYTAKRHTRIARGLHLVDADQYWVDNCLERNPSPRSGQSALFVHHLHLVCCL